MEEEEEEEAGTEDNCQPLDGIYNERKTTVRGCKRKWQ